MSASDEALRLLRELAVDEPWAHSAEGLDDECIFCGCRKERWRAGRVVYLHSRRCAWVEARAFLEQPLPSHHEVAE